MTNPLSRHSSLSPEDWDHSEPTTTMDHSTATATANNTTASAAAPSRVVFPSSSQGGRDDDDDATTSAPAPPLPEGGRSGKRTLSELLKFHAEKGTDVHFTTEEAARLEETLGRWARLFFFFFLLLSYVVAERCSVSCVDYRSTLVRRRTKAMTSFSHGHPMTRSCSCIARRPSIVSSDVHHMVRARV